MKKLMKWAAVLGGSFLAVAFGMVVYLGMNRIVVIADTGSVSEMTQMSDSGGLPGHVLSLQESGEEGLSIRIPMESPIGPENIIMENRYVNRRLVIYVRGATGFFYEKNRVTGYTKSLEAASYTVESEGVTLYLQLSELYEYESILEKGYLQINLYKPAERYEKVVVLDAEVSPGMSGREKDALYRIEEKLRALLEEKDIRVYTAAGREEEVAVGEKLMLAEQTKASLYVGLKLDRSGDAEQFGSYVCYSSLYFRPWLTNGSFADLLEREMVTSINGRALGLVEVEDGVLEELSIPAAIVCPGYLSHEKEGSLLLREAYQDKIAEGICSGIMKTFEELENESDSSYGK